MSGLCRGASRSRPGSRRTSTSRRAHRPRARPSRRRRARGRAASATPQRTGRATTAVTLVPTASAVARLAHRSIRRVFVKKEHARREDRRRDDEVVQGRRGLQQHDGQRQEEQRAERRLAMCQAQSTREREDSDRSRRARRRTGRRSRHAPSRASSSTKVRTSLRSADCPSADRRTHPRVRRALLPPQGGPGRWITTCRSRLDVSSEIASLRTRRLGATYRRWTTKRGSSDQPELAQAPTCPDAGLERPGPTAPYCESAQIATISRTDDVRREEDLRSDRTPRTTATPPVGR